MKRLVSILVLMIAFVVVGNSQTINIKSNTVKDYVYSDTLKKNVELNQIYSISNFVKNMRLTLDADTLKDGYIKATVKVYGSLDKSNWTQIGYTLSLASATATATKDTLFKDSYYQYIKVYTKAIDSTQYVSFKYKLLFDITQ